jgi:hypothetical protein
MQFWILFTSDVNKMDIVLAATFALALGVVIVSVLAWSNADEVFLYVVFSLGVLISAMLLYKLVRPYFVAGAVDNDKTASDQLRRPSSSKRAAAPLSIPAAATDNAVIDVAGVPAPVPLQSTKQRRKSSRSLIPKPADAGDNNVAPEPSVIPYTPSPVKSPKRRQRLSSLSS